MPLSSSSLNQEACGMEAFEKVKAGDMPVAPMRELPGRLREAAAVPKLGSALAIELVMPVFSLRTACASSSPVTERLSTAFLAVRKRDGLTNELAKQLDGTRVICGDKRE